MTCGTSSGCSILDGLSRSRMLTKQHSSRSASSYANVRDLCLPWLQRMMRRPNSLSTHMATSQMTGHVRLAMMRVRVSASNPDPLVSSFHSRRNALATSMQQLWMPRKLFFTNLQCAVSVPNATTMSRWTSSPDAEGGCIVLLAILVQSALDFEKQEHELIN